VFSGGPRPDSRLQRRRRERLVLVATAAGPTRRQNGGAGGRARAAAHPVSLRGRRTAHAARHTARPSSSRQPRASAAVGGRGGTAGAAVRYCGRPARLLACGGGTDGPPPEGWAHCRRRRLRLSAAGPGGRSRVQTGVRRRTGGLCPGVWGRGAGGLSESDERRPGRSGNLDSPSPASTRGVSRAEGSACPLGIRTAQTS
jgi:hypothetical protein